MCEIWELHLFIYLFHTPQQSPNFFQTHPTSPLSLFYFFFNYYSYMHTYI